MPVLRPAVKDDGTDDFTVGEVKGSVKTNAVFLAKPIYLADARISGAEGAVRVRITVDKEGNDYLRTMMDDFSYEVLADVSLLPQRLPQLYRKLTM